LSGEYFRLHWPITALDTTIAHLMIRQLKGGWPFQQAFTPNLVLLDFRPSTFVETLAMQVIMSRMNPGSAHILLARHYEEQGDLPAAAREFNVLPRLVYIEAYALLDRARAYIRCGKSREALPLLLASVQEEEIPLALRLAGEILLEQGEYDKALQYLLRARKLNPAHPKILADLVRAYLRTGQKEMARQEFVQLQRLHGSDSLVVELEKQFQSYRGGR
jgi:tetratricopeptide (TPR) repeat protein